MEQKRGGGGAKILKIGGEGRAGSRGECLKKNGGGRGARTPLRTMGLAWNTVFMYGLVLLAATWKC